MHRCNRFPLPSAADYKVRQDKIFGAEIGFAHQIPESRVLSQPAQFLIRHLFTSLAVTFPMNLTLTCLGTLPYLFLKFLTVEGLVKRTSSNLFQLISGKSSGMTFR